MLQAVPPPEERHADRQRHRHRQQGQQRLAQQRALRTSVTGFSIGELAAGLALAAVVIVGVRIGVGGDLTVGQLTAFLFLVTLFIQPVQIATEVLNEAQNAIAGWRRVLDVLDVLTERLDEVGASPALSVVGVAALPVDGMLVALDGLALGTPHRPGRI